MVPYCEKKVLDASSGSKMFWFNKINNLAVFLDKRREKHWLKDSSNKNGGRILSVQPDVKGDFTALPFPDKSFHLVVFDPPHLIKVGENGWLAKKYGKLPDDWKSELSIGFSECFRVLKDNGTLIFKWNERDIPVHKILELTNEKPLFGNRHGKTAQSHWLVFMKVDGGSK